MSEMWYAAFGATLAAVVVLTVVVLGILRRTIQALARVEALLTEREADSLDISLPMVGQVNPLEVASLIPYRENFTITFLELGCDACRSLASDLGSRRYRRTASASNQVVVVDELVAEFSGLPTSITVLQDAEGKLFDEWKVSATPTSYYVGAAGLIRAGHHPNKAHELESLREKAVEDIRHSHPAHAN